MPRNWLHYNTSLLVILWLQLKLIRYNEDEKDLKWFLQVADEENVLVKRSASTFQCSLCLKYQCLHCNKFFSQSLHLRMHIKQVHAKIRDHQCQLCNYAASENQSVIRHLGCYCNLKYCRSFCDNIWTAIEFRNKCVVADDLSGFLSVLGNGTYDFFERGCPRV